jgi:hypothetical protein
VAEKWAQKCAKLEKGASGFIFEATQEYAAKYAAGWSYERIADEVTAAGFPISRKTVRRRIEALAQVEGSGGVAEEAAFIVALAAINEAESGRAGAYGPLTSTLPKNEQGLINVLEQAARKLEKEYDRSTSEIASYIHQTAPKAPTEYVEAEVRRTKVDPNWDILDRIAQLIQELEPPLSKRAQSKYDQVVLALQVIGEEMAVR